MIFPVIQPQITGTPAELPVYKEIQWDFADDKPLYENGNPVIVERNAAILVWAWKTLHTERFRYEVFTQDYGNEIYDIVGQAFSEELKQSEAARYVGECLRINPYITDVREVVVEFSQDKITVACSIVTIYGEIAFRG